MTETVLPPHVPKELVRDFNHYELVGPPHEQWQRIQAESPPIFFSPFLGGYWIIMSADLLDIAWKDADRFSSADGIGIPPLPKDPPMLPIEADDPFHRILLKPLSVALSPRAVSTLSTAARELAVETIEKLKPQGGCDFVADFSLKMPMDLFLRIVDLPISDRDHLIELAHVLTKSGDADTRANSAKQVFGYLDEHIRERSKNPGNDLISLIVNLDAGGRPLTHNEKLGYVAVVLLGGLDTVGAAMGFIAKHLAENPDDRRFLAANHSAIPMAIEEMIRRYASPSIARTVTRDTELGGVCLKKGDRIMLSTIAHGVDEKRWPDALKVKLDRRPIGHASFGKGVHACPGANLARTEIRIFIEEWLARIPDFSIEEGALLSYAPGQPSLLSLPLVW